MLFSFGVLSNIDIVFKWFFCSVICFGKLFGYDMVMYFFLGKRLIGFYMFLFIKSVWKFGGRLKKLL